MSARLPGVSRARRSTLLLLSFVAALTSLSAQPAPRRAVSLIVTGGTVVTMDGSGRILSPGAVAVDGARIAAVDTPEVIARQFSSASTVNAAGRIVLPGLINTHTHAPMVLYRGLADDLALMDWLQKYIFPAEARTVSPAFVRTGTRLAVLEMIRTGTTMYADMYYFEEEIARATKEAGLRGVLGQTIIEFPVADASAPSEALARAEKFILTWHKDDLITPAVAPHAMYTLNEDMLRRARDLAARYSVPMLIHLAETEDEVKISAEKYKLRPVQFLEDRNLWAPLTVAAHGVWVDANDIAVLKKRNVGVSHNPESNMKLASGAAPVPAYLQAEVPLGLGTDGAASNNDLDMFEAMRQAAFLHKLVTRDPRAVSAQQALRMATIGGARVLGRETDLGSIEAGKLADLIVVRTDRPGQVPMYDPVSHLVYASHGSDVETTIVNGRMLMRDGKVLTLNEAQVIAEARKAAEAVRKAVVP